MDEATLRAPVPEVEACDCTDAVSSGVELEDLHVASRLQWGGASARRSPARPASPQFSFLYVLRGRVCVCTSCPSLLPRAGLRAFARLCPPMA